MGRKWWSFAFLAVFFAALLCSGCSGGAGREAAASAPNGGGVASKENPAVPADSPAQLLASLPADLPPDLPPDARLDLAVLRAAYPDAAPRLEQSATGRLDLVLAGGRRLAYDDGRVRTPAQSLEDPDIRTMLALTYPLGPVTEATARPAPGFDPGRWRVAEFFMALYGRSEAEVRAACVGVAFDGRRVTFNARHGAAAALERVGRRLAALEHRPEHHLGLAPVLRPLGGTLAWRAIAGTSRPSMHSFAAAVDLNPHLPYWRTERHPESVPGRCLAFPPELLAAFEAEGFIWGGKWAAYDLMHFEYRPELILKARALRGELTLP